MLTLSNPRLQDSHPLRAGFDEHRALTLAHVAWAAVMICLASSAGPIDRGAMI